MQIHRMNTRSIQINLKEKPFNNKLNPGYMEQKSHSQADCFHWQVYPPCEERGISTDPLDQFQVLWICLDFLGYEC